MYNPTQSGKPFVSTSHQRPIYLVNIQRRHRSRNQFQRAKHNLKDGLPGANQAGKLAMSCAGALMALVLLTFLTFLGLFGTTAYLILSHF